MAEQAPLYVHTDAMGEPRLVGRFSMVDERVGHFSYAATYLDWQRGFSVDPVNLPLTDIPAYINEVPHIFGVLLDAGPDDWGQRVYLHRKRRQRTRMELLAELSGGGVGALLFSNSRSAVHARSVAPDYSQLEDALVAATAVEQGKQLPDRYLKLLEHGSSMGGARPKALVTHEGSEWLAKFPSVRDVLDQPRVEYATLQLARQTGITVPDHRLEVLPSGKAVLLVKRFDVREGRRLHYISLYSIFVAGRKMSEARDAPGDVSYMGISKFLARHGKDNGDRSEAFARMVFSVLMGHVDDHSRNHGFLMDPETLQYVLAPAFDIAPSNGTIESITHVKDHQSIGIGRHGTIRTAENMLSAVGDFALNEARALNIVARVRDAVARWQDVFAAAGVTPADRELIRRRVLAKEVDVLVGADPGPPADA